MIQLQRAPNAIEAAHAGAYSVHSAENIRGLLDSISKGPQKNAGPGGNVRIALANPTSDRMEIAARIASRGIPHHGQRGIWFTPVPPEQGKCAFLFPGAEYRSLQLRELAISLGREPPGEIQDTTDPLSEGRRAMEAGLLMDYALQRIGIYPDARIGSSCGEWTALIAAGGLQSSRLMDRNHIGLECPNFTYLAVAVDADTLETILDQEYLRGCVFISHRNSPRQSIACAPPSETRRLQGALVSRGIRAMPVAVRSGFHCRAYAHYVDNALAFLDLRCRAPHQEVWSCVSAQPIPDDDKACSHLVRQAFTEPVDFEKAVRTMHASGVRTFIDLGGGSLAQLTDEILTGLSYVSTATAHHARDGASCLQRTLLALWASHRNVDPNALAMLASGNADLTQPTGAISHEYRN